MENEMKHELAFNDGGADWCVHCGMFDHWLSHYPKCDAKDRNKYGKGHTERKPLKDKAANVSERVLKTDAL